MKPKVEEQPKLKLYYFDIKGKGEPIRLLCAHAGLELEDHRFASRDEFLAMKEGSQLAFGQVPMLEVDGKHALVQTSAIMRYLGKLSGLYPENDPLLAAKVDAAMDQEGDSFAGITVLSYAPRFGIDLTEAATEASYDNINNRVLPRHLGSIEKCLDDSSTGWIAGTEDPSPADFLWYVRLSTLGDNKKLTDKIKTLEDFPKIMAFVSKFEDLEAIRKYYGLAD
jgi:glutathione S-transferase